MPTMPQSKVQSICMWIHLHVNSARGLSSCSTVVIKKARHINDKDPLFCAVHHMKILAG